MTEQHFPQPIRSFSSGCIPAPLSGPIDILAEGRSALEKANQELGEQRSLKEGPGQQSKGAVSHNQLLWGCLLGLALDSWDLDFYTKRFQELQRNPSIVEVFDLAQSNRWGGMGTFWCLSLWRLEETIIGTLHGTLLA